MVQGHQSNASSLVPPIGLRLKLKKNITGTVVKIYKSKGKTIKTCGILWDNDWPRDVGFSRNPPGKVFYYKPEDLEVIDTWRI